MESTLFEAPEYDPAMERRRRNRIIAIVAAVVVLAVLAFLFRNWPYTRVADHFFAAIEQKQFEKAYGIWRADPDWQKHPDKHKNYPFNEFYVDWGPSSEWGTITSHKVLGAVRNGSGVIVEVRLNGRAEPARIWVDRSDKTITFSPF